MNRFCKMVSGEAHSSSCVATSGSGPVGRCPLLAQMVVRVCVCVQLLAAIGGVKIQTINKLRT